MPTKREREYYRMGFRDGQRYVEEASPYQLGEPRYIEGTRIGDVFKEPKRKRKLSAWNKFVKANSKKPRFRYRNGKLNLKKMAIAFRKTPAGRKRKK